MTKETRVTRLTCMTGVDWVTRVIRLTGVT